MLYKIIDTEDKKKQLAARHRELSKAKKRIAEIDTLIQKICDTRAAPGHLPYGGCPKERFFCFRKDFPCLPGSFLRPFFRGIFWPA